ncbi:vanillyl-alcohol oxidase [Emericellopsis atlantica]|uniref:Vanillyl-alcohol oxidase n=1 Tax=Emericellopsis atlantica TaxID=2614577 RepID=A0A9P7ZRU0_9HYPO|nr:vanillyl-alcohol oxidase [Emericellopsis atlantica]KAG9256520.1 vanillyl-alcohol oxidase [Emericellopsis atlantica]
MASAFFDEAADAIGADNVSRDRLTGSLPGPMGEVLYGDVWDLFPQKPIGAVRPSSVEELQQVIRLANKHLVPLWTVSRGKNLGYGGTTPVAEGNVVLDLHRMNKIVEINEEFGYAIVEPGVSFFDLYEEIKRRKLKLWMSVPAIGWGSVVGNASERGFGFTPLGVHADAQTGLEVVLPSGELLRPGMGAVSDQMFALYKDGFGPGLENMFKQSNLGVITKLGMHMYPAPEAYSRCVLSVPRDADFVRMVDTMANLRRRGVVGNVPHVWDIQRQVAINRDMDVLQLMRPHWGADKAYPLSLYEEIIQKTGWHWWYCQFALYGSPEIVKAQLETVKRVISQDLPGAKLQVWDHVASPGEVLDATVETDAIPSPTGVPSILGIQMLDMIRGEGTGHTDFAPVLPPSGKLIYEWFTKVRAMCIEAGFNCEADFHIHARYSIPMALICFVRSERERVSQLYPKIVDATTALGYISYRVHVGAMDQILGAHTFNDGALGKFLTSLKDHMDPNGILSPGKSGIWNSAAKAGR